MRNAIKGLAAFALCLSMAAGMPVEAALAKGDVIRLGGSTRYDTMHRTVSEAFATSTYAVIATGEDYPDALAASALAGARNCPIILTEGKSLSPQAKQQLKRLKVSEAYVVGGPDAVSDATFEEVKGIAKSVHRVSGDSRVGTSVAVLNEVRRLNTYPRTVFIASGNSFADALAISPYAFKKKTPVVLVNSDGMLSDEAVAAIRNGGYSKAYVLGGDDVVNFDAVTAKLAGISTGRIAGGDRYATARAIVDFEIGEGMDFNNAAIATGRDYPDALVGGVLCGLNNSILALVDGPRSQNLDSLEDYSYLVRSCYVLGGEGAVSRETKSRVEGFLDSSEYFLRTNSDESTTRFKTVRVSLSGVSSSSFTMAPGDSRVILPLKSGDATRYSVKYPSEARVMNRLDANEVTLVAEGRKLILRFGNGSGRVDQALWISGYAEDALYGTVSIVVGDATGDSTPVKDSDEGWLGDDEESARAPRTEKVNWLQD